MGLEASNTGSLVLRSIEDRFLEPEPTGFSMEAWRLSSPGPQKENLKTAAWEFPKNQGPLHRPRTSMVLILRTPKRTPN